MKVIHTLPRLYISDSPWSCLYFLTLEQWTLSRKQSAGSASNVITWTFYGQKDHNYSTKSQSHSERVSCEIYFGYLLSATKLHRLLRHTYDIYPSPRTHNDKDSQQQNLTHLWPAWLCLLTPANVSLEGRLWLKVPLRCLQFSVSQSSFGLKSGLIQVLGSDFLTPSKTLLDKFQLSHTSLCVWFNNLFGSEINIGVKSASSVA